MCCHLRVRPHEPGEQAKGYRIERVLGTGGSGTTYEATREVTGERVALKQLSLAGASAWKEVELFEREASVLGRLKHPAIPRYIDHFSLDGPEGATLYLAQELVLGRSLAEIAGPKGRPLTEAEVRALAAQVLPVLEYLGAQEPPVIHRDLTPTNILRRDDGSIAIVDFGAARAHVTEAGGGTTTIGTYGYMAPEQLHGVASPAADIYGLACTLLFLLTGLAPSELPRRRLQIDFRQKVSVSDGFARWLDKALQPVPEDRFPSARAALDALRKLDAKRGPGRPLIIVGAVAVFGLVVVAPMALSLLREPRVTVSDPPPVPSPHRHAPPPISVRVPDHAESCGPEAKLIVTLTQDVASQDRMALMAVEEGTPNARFESREPEAWALEQKRKWYAIADSIDVTEAQVSQRFTRCLPAGSYTVQLWDQWGDKGQINNGLPPQALSSWQVGNASCVLNLRAGVATTVDAWSTQGAGGAAWVDWGVGGK